MLVMNVVQVVGFGFLEEGVGRRDSALEPATRRTQLLGREVSFGGLIR